VFGCGVFKSLTKNNISLEAVAGTSISGVNAAIIAGYNEQRYDNAQMALGHFYHVDMIRNHSRNYWKRPYNILIRQLK
jgi:predicted acylesterase/phospholipase RssA